MQIIFGRKNRSDSSHVRSRLAEFPFAGRSSSELPAQDSLVTLGRLVL